jgi:hypothetical protein
MVIVLPLRCLRCRAVFVLQWCFFILKSSVRFTGTGFVCKIRTIIFFFYFKLSPISECWILSFWWFSGAWILCADVSEHNSFLSYITSYTDFLFLMTGTLIVYHWPMRPVKPFDTYLGILIMSSHKSSNSNKEGVQSVSHHFCPSLPVSLTLCPIS